MRHKRLRKRVAGTAERPRLAVHFSGRHVYVQIIDDDKCHTLVSANTTEAELRDEANANVPTAQKIGSAIAERAGRLQISKIVFDRGGFRYHGKIKALADAARAGGLIF